MVPIGHFMVRVTRGRSPTRLHLGRPRHWQVGGGPSAGRNVESPAARCAGTLARSSRPTGPAVPGKRRSLQVGDARVLTAGRIGHSLPGRTECGAGLGTGELLPAG